MSLDTRTPEDSQGIESSYTPVAAYDLIAQSARNDESKAQAQQSQDHSALLAAMEASDSSDPSEQLNMVQDEVELELKSGIAKLSKTQTMQRIALLEEKLHRQRQLKQQRQSQLFRKAQQDKSQVRTPNTAPTATITATSTATSNTTADSNNQLSDVLSKIEQLIYETKRSNNESLAIRQDLRKELSSVHTERDQDEQLKRQEFAVAQDRQRQSNVLMDEMQAALDNTFSSSDQLSTLIDDCKQLHEQNQQNINHSKLEKEEMLVQFRSLASSAERDRNKTEGLVEEVAGELTQTKELIGELSQQAELVEVNQQQSRKLNAELKESLRESFNDGKMLRATFRECLELKKQTSSLLTSSNTLNQQSIASIDKVNDAIDSAQLIGKELTDLSRNSEHAYAETRAGLEQMRSCIGEFSELNQMSDSLNKESKVITSTSKLAAEKLIRQLKSSTQLNKQYQDRLSLAEQKYSNASVAQEKYQQLYQQSLQAVQEGQSLIDESTAVLRASTTSTQEFTDTVKQFQQSNNTSQQIILQTQTDVRDLIQKNQTLIQENRQLKEQYLTPTKSVNVFPITQASSNEFASEFNQAKMPEKAQGFYRIMMVLAIVLPLSFILGTAIVNYTSSGELQLTSTASAESLSSVNANILTRSQTSSVSLIKPANFPAGLNAAVKIRSQHINPDLQIPTAKQSPQDSAWLELEQTDFQWPLLATAQQDLAASYHQARGGINIYGAAGQDVYAVSDGEVIYSDDSLKGYGNIIMIKHSGDLISIYGSNSINRVQVGDRVNRGQLIASVGQLANNSSNGLYFEVRYNGKTEDPFHYLNKPS